MARLVPKIYPSDVAEHIPVGIGFPLNVGSYKYNYTTKAQVSDNLRNLILTMKGERIMHPEFGTDLYFLLFEQLQEDELSTAARMTIDSAIKLWMPGITLDDVSVTESQNAQSILIAVDYSIEGWPASSTLNLTVKI